MDGRIQRKVSDYLTTSFGVRHLDTITAAGLVKHLAVDTHQTDALLSNLDMSTTAHGSRHVAIVAHHDCAGNAVADKTQRQQVASAVTWLSDRHPDLEVIGLWLGDNWIVERIRP